MCLCRLYVESILGIRAVNLSMELKMLRDMTTGANFLVKIPEHLTKIWKPKHKMKTQQGADPVDNVEEKRAEISVSYLVVVICVWHITQNVFIQFWWLASKNNRRNSNHKFLFSLFSVQWTGQWMHTNFTRIYFTLPNAYNITNNNMGFERKRRNMKKTQMIIRIKSKCLKAMCAFV